MNQIGAAERALEEAKEQLEGRQQALLFAERRTSDPAKLEQFEQLVASGEATVRQRKQELAQAKLEERERQAKRQAAEAEADRKLVRSFLVDN